MFLTEAGLPAINSNYLKVTIILCQNIVKSVVSSSKYSSEIEMPLFNDLDYKWNRTSHAGGYLAHPKGNGRFVITLNEAMNRDTESMSDEEFDKYDKHVQNILLHELCHYVVAKIYLGQGRFVWNNGRVGYNTRDIFIKSEYAQNEGHNRLWKEIANMVGSASGQDITRYMSAEEFADVGMKAALDNKVKYVIECPKCHATWEYQRMSKAVENPGRFSCGKCRVSLIRTK